MKYILPFLIALLPACESLAPQAERVTPVPQEITDFDRLEGEWRLIEPDYEGSEAPTLRFDRTRISGSGGCNRYMGLVAPGDNRNDISTTGPLAGTMMACPPPTDANERDFLSKLQNIRQFSVGENRLSLLWNTDDEEGLLIFERAD